MTRRLIFPGAVLVLVTAAIAALLAIRPASPDFTCPDKLGNSVEVAPDELPAGANVGAGSLSVRDLTYAQTLTAWMIDRRKQPPDLLSGRDALEACQPFPQGVDLNTLKTNCTPQQFGTLNVNNLDWHDRLFMLAALRGPVGGAQLLHVNLMNSSITGGSAEGAFLLHSLLGCAKFTATKLNNAAFHYADLRGAVLRGTDLTDAFFAFANLDGTTYEPLSGKLPNVGSMASAPNLQGMTYEHSPVPLSELREALYRGGMAEQARKVTYAIEHTRRLHDGQSKDPITRASSWLRLVAFEWTVAYGMNPFQPLALLLVLIPAFAPFYLAAIPGGGAGGLWVCRPKGAIARGAQEQWLPVHDLVRGRRLAQLKMALWFSVMCAFRIGYKEVNVGDWITRLQPREYLLGATGWFRTVSGVQSLLSVYFLALTEIGRASCRERV